MSFVHSILALMQFGFLLIIVGFLFGIEPAVLAGIVMVFAALGSTALVVVCGAVACHPRAQGWFA